MRDPTDRASQIPAKPAENELPIDAPKEPSAPDEPRIVAPALETSNDFGLQVAVAIPLANGGDAKAADLVARAFEYCSFYSQSSDKFKAHIDALASASPDQGAALRAVGSKIEERCAGVSPGEPITDEEIRRWQAIASKGGHLPALIRTAVTDVDSVSDEEKGQLFRAAANSREPQTVLEAASLISFAAAVDYDGLPVGGGEIDQYAWEIAACRLGAPCARGSLFMDQLCLSGGGCNAASYEDLVRNQYIAQGSDALLDQKVRAVLAHLTDSKSR
jgi:hypothetical protein